jgi:hypothetical protein
MALGSRSHRGAGRRWPWSRRADRGPAGSASEAHAPADAAPIDPRTALRQRAEACVVGLDDALHASADELDWARRQLGEATTEPFGAPLAAAGAALARAMAELQAARAGAGTPDEADHLTATLTQCREGGSALDQPVPDLDAARDLQHAVIDLRPALRANLVAELERSAAATRSIESSLERWRTGGLAGAQMHLHRARQGLAFAEACLDALEGAAGAAVASHGAGLVRLAEASLSQSDRLLEQVEHAPGMLELAERAMDVLLSEARVDRADAQRLGVPADRAWEFADDTVEWALGAIGGQVDPVAMRRALEESEAALHSALTAVRDPTDALRRARSLLPTAGEAAAAMLHVGELLVRTRCGAVGVEARVRLAEAQRLLDAGGRTDEPAAALAQLQRADRLAEQAAVLAQQDEVTHRDARRRAAADWDPARETAILLGALLPLEPTGWAAVRYGGPSTRTRLRCVLPSELSRA